MRKPNVIIGSPEEPYLLRWHIIPKNPIFNIYLHCFLRSDDDRALHDHPWTNMSILLKGRYFEYAKTGRYLRMAGDIVFRPRGTFAHRIELIKNEPCWTLFLTGPRYRVWGFHCPKGWVPWQDFTKAGNPGEVGPGCGE